MTSSPHQPLATKRDIAVTVLAIAMLLVLQTLALSVIMAWMLKLAV